MLATLPHRAQSQLIEQYYPTGIPGYESWLSDAVRDRAHTEYTPLGVRTGDFVIHPFLSEGVGYDSNVFGTPHAVGSALAVTEGDVAVGSDWSRDALDASAGFIDQRDLAQPKLSHTDWNAGLGGTIDIGHDRASLGYAHVTTTTVPVGIGTLSVGQPITITFDSAHASYEATLGRFTLQPALGVDIYRFAAGGAGGGAGVAEDNRDTFTGSLTGGYTLAPGRSVVLVLTGTDAQYPVKTPGAPSLDYTDVSLVGGLDFRTGALFRYRALVGYEERSYDAAGLASTSSPVAELDVIWTPTRVTTVTAQVSRSLQNTVAAAAAAATQSYTYTSARLAVDHEYLRNVLLGGFAGLQIADFQTHGETQHVVSAGATVTWLINRRISLLGRFAYTRSTDNVNAALNESDNLAELTLGFHL